MPENVRRHYTVPTTRSDWSRGAATEQCRKTAIGNARRCRQDLIGREGYAKGATEQCRKTPIDNTHRCRQRGDGLVTSGYAGTDRDKNCRKTSIDNTRSRRQDLIGREGYTKGATKQCRKTPIDNTRGSRQRGKGSVTSYQAGTDRDEQCWKMSIDITRSGRHAPIGQEGYTKGATELCRKTSIENTRSSRQDFIGRPRSIFNIFPEYFCLGFGDTTIEQISHGRYNNSDV